jgi:hypothetical protein
MARKDDGTGPTEQREKHAGEFMEIRGLSRTNRRVQMLDDQLGRAWKINLINAEEYSALKKYSLHWLAGGLQGSMCSVDPDRILATNAGAMSGLAKTERQAYHRQLYWRAHERLGTRPAFVADHVACFDTKLSHVALSLGYASPYRGREKVREILSDAGYRLGKFWQEQR